MEVEKLPLEASQIWRQRILLEMCEFIWMLGFSSLYPTHTDKYGTQLTATADTGINIYRIPINQSLRST